MEVVLRPVNDAFLKEVVFPALELGVVDAVPAIDHLISKIGDDETRATLEILQERGVEGSFFGLEDTRWSIAIYRILFYEWVRTVDGWQIIIDDPKKTNAYAGDWEDTLHLALMLEDDAYPYADEKKAEPYRKSLLTSPFNEQGLASMVCGMWNPVPSFPPDQVLTVQGRGEYRPNDGIARADWSWRALTLVNQWGAQLPNQLSRVLQKETKRLKPVEAPEKHEVLDYWLGRVPKAPVLAVTFSGLGEKSTHWIREIGRLARCIRAAAAKQQGMMAIISHRGDEDYLANQ